MINNDNQDYRLKLSIINSKLANQRTYMSYIRTGLAISAIALTFKKYKLVALGILMIFIGTFEYYYVRYVLIYTDLHNYYDFAYGPFVISFFVLLALYMEIKTHNVFKNKIINNIFK
jgi:uncharacterized membrane protein YidH (DUF202 family)